MLTDQVQTRLATWFHRHGRDLPWREPNCTPWGVLVSEVMSQQTPLARVEPVWLDWMSRWPGPQELAAAPTSEVLRVWSNLGYPRRALRLQECARVVETDFGGQLPQSEAELLTLPGIGAYTAASVRAFAFGKRAVVLDTNVRRVLARIFDGTALPTPHMSVAQVRAADQIVPVADAEAAQWSVSSMEFGALVCTARAPRCGECPITDLCAWRAAGYPPDEHAERRRGQPWQGTDRQIRGQIMRALREAPGAVPRLQLDASWPAPRPEPSQVERCISALAADGLLHVSDDDATLTLP